MGRIKRKVSSLSYYLQKTYWKISTAKPSLLITSITIVGLAVFLLAGGIFSVLESIKYPVALYTGGRFLFFYPSLNEQILSEGVLVTMLYALGVTGLAIMYQSTKYAYKPRQAYLTLFLGVSLFLIAYALIEYLLTSKLTFRFQT
jgi:hypothetical protein